MSIVQDFKKFALRGNIIDLAIAFTVGAAFSTIAKSLVEDVLMPPIGLVIGGADFSNNFFVLKEGSAAAGPYATLAAAKAAGAVTLNFGVFINHLIAFIVVALAMFAIIRAVNKADAALEHRFAPSDKTDDEPSDKKCPFCLSTVPYRAVRCGHCTSHLDEPAVEG